MASHQTRNGVRTHASGMTMTQDFDTDARTFLYACVGEKVITYRVDVLAAALVPAGEWSAPGNVQYGCFDLQRGFLYLAFSDGGPASSGRNHGLVALRLDGESGALQTFGPIVPLPSRPIHCTISPDGRFIASVFNRPADIAIHAIAADGSLGPAIAQDQTIDMGVCPHQSRFTPSGHHLIVSERGTDTLGTCGPVSGGMRVLSFEEGRLRFIKKVGRAAGTGFEPRNIDFSPDGNWLYLVLESQNELCAYPLLDDVPTDEAAFVETILEHPFDHHFGQVGGGVKVNPNGGVVYAANRSHGYRMLGDRRVNTGGEDGIAVFEVDAEDGRPRLIQHARTTGIGPRTFAWDDQARLFIAANWMKQWRMRDDGTLKEFPPSLDLFRMDERGRLEHATTYPIDMPPRTLFWIGMFSPRL